ncbi:MAG: hypothetical protein KC619_25960 [Myxococcales bacterium]|nr:hypothetical protein [Myxococcales bacterium]
MNKRLGWLLAGALFAFGALPLVGQAQDDEGSGDAAEERAMTMEAAEPGAQTENIPGGLMTVSAYGLIWIAVFGYVVWIGIRQARLAGDLVRLREDLAKAKRAEED